MSRKKIIEQDWSEYDNKKKRGGSDHRDFACTETWEVDYLVRVIRKVYPNLTDEKIKVAIKACCVVDPAPRPREIFIKCVTGKLSIPDV